MFLFSLWFSTLLFAGDPSLVRVYLTNPKMEVPQLQALHLDLAGRDVKAKALDFLMTPEERQKVEALGFQTLVLKPPEALKVIDPNYHDPAEIEALLADYETLYPNLCQRFNLGTSEEGRTIWGLKISDNPSLEEDEPAVLFVAQHHAREVMSPEVILDIIDYLLTRYGADPEVTAWVDNLEIWCVPVENPDGAAYAFSTQPMWRKDRHNNGDGSFGVDPNRNYPYRWGACNGSSSSTWAEDYRGPSPASQPETQAMIQLGQAQRFVFAITYHAYSELVIYPYGCYGSYTPEHDLIQAIGQALANKLITDDGNGTYTDGTGWELLYPVDGEMTDWFYAIPGTIGYTIELNSPSLGFQPPYSWRDSTVQRNRPGWQYLLNRIEGPSFHGHVYDACSQAPLVATMNRDNLAWPNGESPRTSEPLYGSFHWIVLPGDHTFSFSLSGYDPQTLPITIGDEAVYRDIYLVPQGSYGLTYQEVNLLDIPGDGDGVVDPGEEIQFSLTLLATGDDLTGVSLQVSTTDPYVTILSDTLSYGDILSGQVGAPLSGTIKLYVDPTTPEGHELVLSFHYLADQPLCVSQEVVTFRVSSLRERCPFWEEPLDTDPGWTNLGNQAFSFGFPTYGPPGAHTGTNVYGTNLNGSYVNNALYLLETDAIPIQGILNPTLKFWRYLYNETGYDPAYVEVSKDGTNWVRLWSGFAKDTTWQAITLPLPEGFSGSETVQFRFGLETDSSITYPGFYLDDLSICGEDYGEGCLINLGDLDRSGDLSSFDASLLLQGLVGLISLDEEQTCRADADGSGDLSAYDASCLLQCLVDLCNGLPSYLPFQRACQTFGYCQNQFIK